MWCLPLSLSIESVTAFFNTGLSQQQFLDQYWQKQPLLIHNAFPTPVIDLTAEDLAGFACEQDIESRLICQTGDQKWSLQQGPLAESVFAQLPEKNWTLLVQDMDSHWPPLQTLLTPFKFIPDWRRDDIMVSYAVPGGSVGAHLDNYDVFLLQAQGVRRWQIAAQPEHQPQWLAGCPLRILQHFTAEHSWDLQPGDILYLPPGFAHHGIAQSDCMTISIGFRAPTQRQLLDAFVDALAEKDSADVFYSDADLLATNTPAAIDDASLRRAKKLLIDALEQHPDLIVKALGRQVTETKPALSAWLSPDTDELETMAALDAFFAQGGILKRNLMVRLAWYCSTNSVSVFVGSQDYQLPAESASQVANICEAPQLNAKDWQQIQRQPTLVDLLLAMLEDTAWFPEDAD
ncbi:MAG: cupin domain-containing protein [Methylophaga sp.]|nr:cupin domain-containing protein [Methylophaga sp.]